MTYLQPENMIMSAGTAVAAASATSSSFSISAPCHEDSALVQVGEGYLSRATQDGAVAATQDGAVAEAADLRHMCKSKRLAITPGQIENPLCSSITMTKIVARGEPCSILSPGILKSSATSFRIFSLLAA